MRMSLTHLWCQELRIDSSTTVIYDVAAYPGTDQQQRRRKAPNEPDHNGWGQHPTPPSFPRDYNEKQHCSRLNAHVPEHEAMCFFGVRWHCKEGQDSR
jgi:hypothetical protein